LPQSKQILKAAAEKKAARVAFITEFSKELRAFGGLILKAREYVKASGLREFTREEVELMLKRATDRATEFDVNVLKPLRADLKRREQERRKA
jgi:hypothetical protein